MLLAIVVCRASMRRLVLLLFLLTACSHSAARGSSGLGSPAEADVAFSEATASRGIEGFTDFIAEDFHTVEANGSPSDRAAYLKEWSRLLSTPETSIRWRPVLSGADGDLGWTSEVYDATGPGGKVSSGRYVSIWKRQPAGKWKVVFDMGAPNLPQAAPAQ